MAEEGDRTLFLRCLQWKAAAATLCEARLLKERKHATRVLRLLDRITADLTQEKGRRSEEFQALRKGLGDFWSVAVVAAPAQGKRLMEKWFAEEDQDIRWVMRQNLRKERLTRMDSAWARRWRRWLEA